MNVLREQLIRIFSEILDINSEDISDDASTDTISNWDSMNHLLIITEIEKRFGISIPLEDSIELTNFKEIFSYITEEREATEINISKKDYDKVEIQGEINKTLINKTTTKLNKTLIPQLNEFISRNYNLNYILLNDIFFNYFFNNYLSEDFSFTVILIQNKIIGMLGRIPCKLKCFEKLLDGCFFANLMIEKLYKNQGLGPRLVIDSENKYDIQMVLSYAAKTVSIFQKLKWVEMPHLRRFVKILSPQKCSILTQKEFLINNTDSEIHNNSLKFLEINNFNNQFTEFWNRVKNKYPITVERSIEYLNWRYVNHPLLKYHIFMTLKYNKIMAYVVLRIENPSGFKIGRIIDFISIDETEEYTLIKIIQYCKENDVDLIDFFFTGSFHIKTLNQLNFKEANEEPFSCIPILFNPISWRKKNINFAFKIQEANLFNDRFNDIENWYLTKGDGDQDRPN